MFPLTSMNTGKKNGILCLNLHVNNLTICKYCHTLHILITDTPFLHFLAGEWSLRTFKYWPMRFLTSSLTWSGPGRYSSGIHRNAPCYFKSKHYITRWFLSYLLSYFLLWGHFFVFCVRVDQAGVICQQEGIFRVNCMDCLDRTNVVQAAIARVVMEQQVKKKKIGDIHLIIFNQFRIILFKILINQQSFYCLSSANKNICFTFTQPSHTFPWPK